MARMEGICTSAEVSTGTERRCASLKVYSACAPRSGQKATAHSGCAMAKKPQLVMIPTAPLSTSLCPASTNREMKSSSYFVDETTCDSAEFSAFSRIKGNGHVAPLKGSPGGRCNITSMEMKPSGGSGSTLSRLIVVMACWNDGSFTLVIASLCN